MSAVPSWAVLCNRELSDSLGPAFQSHVGAMSRKWTLRAQMLQYRHEAASIYVSNPSAARRG
jgi:hypothetical protein